MGMRKSKNSYSSPVARAIVNNCPSGPEHIQTTGPKALFGDALILCNNHTKTNELWTNWKNKI